MELQPVAGSGGNTVMVGQPVAVVGRIVIPQGFQDIQKVGPFFNPQNQDSLLMRSSWSDGLCSCANDFEICCLSMLCPCIAIHQILDRIGLVSAGPIGLVHTNKYLILFTAMLVGSLVVSFIPLGHAVSYVGMVVLQFLVLRGIREKLRVIETDTDTCVKSFCCPCCFLSQVSRHASRVQGFLPILPAEETMLEPLVAQPVVASALPPFTASAPNLQAPTSEGGVPAVQQALQAMTPSTPADQELQPVTAQQFKQFSEEAAEEPAG